MERRDYLVSQIQEMGAFLAKLLGLLQKKAVEQEEEQFTAVARDALSVHFGWDLEELLFLDDSSFISLMEDNLLADQHYEQLASIFEFMGDQCHGRGTLLRKELYLKKALLLLEYVQYRSSTYSMELEEKIMQIKVRMSR